MSIIAKLSDPQVKEFVTQLEERHLPKLSFVEVLDLVAAVADRSGTAAIRVREQLTDDGITRQQQVTVAQQGLTPAKTQDLQCLLSEIEDRLSVNDLNFLRAVAGVETLDHSLPPVGPAAGNAHRLVSYWHGNQKIVDLLDPDAAAAHAGSMFTSHDHDTRGILDVATASFMDVQQGDLGDCYILSVIASILSLPGRRQDLHGIVKERYVRQGGAKDSYFDVSLYPVDSERGKAVPGNEPEQTRVDRDFHTQWGAKLYARTWQRPDGPQKRRHAVNRFFELMARLGTIELSDAAKESQKQRTRARLLAPVLEKAIAGESYENLDHGGMAKVAMARLLGKKALSMPVKKCQDLMAAQGGTLADFFKRSYLENQMPIVLGTPPGDDSESKDGLFFGHAYAVVGMPDDQTLMLLEPNRKKEYGDDGDRDGVFPMSIEDIATRFSSLSFVSG